MADGNSTPQKSLVKDGHSLAHATAENAPLVPGRREFFKYRDLGVAKASGGQLKAQVMTAVKGMTEPTGWHYHQCEGQFVYIMKGWVDLEFETGERVRAKAGESLFIPGGMLHNEFGTSEDLEILEILLPSEMKTVPTDPPAGMKG
ncbi:MAG: cupin domain-containing protein [Hyphomicrobiaceae bacterium]